jgi:hypothetical protein
MQQVIVGESFVQHHLVLGGEWAGDLLESVKALQEAIVDGI